MNSNPLVSIIVITYNSSKYVLETLESAKNQTYQNIELIISDDASKDDTVNICREWLKIYKDRFVRTKLITASKNSGIPANCNKGVKASKGEWIKLFAGDDLIEKDMIFIYMNFLKNNNKNYFICSDYFLINEKSELIGSINLNGTKYFNQCDNAEDQFKIALRVSGTVPPLTAFFSRLMYDSIGGYDERYSLLEDYPFFLKLNESGYYAVLINENLASYRKSSASVTSFAPDRLFNPIFLQTYKFQSDYCIKRVAFWERIGFIYNRKTHFLFSYLGLNSKKYKSLYWLIYRLNPYILKRYFFGCENKNFYINKL